MSESTAEKDDAREVQPWRFDTVFVVVPVLIGVWFCILRRGEVFLYGDELHSLRLVDRPYSELIRLFDSSGALLPMLQKFSIGMFGYAPSSFRLPSTLGALGAMAIAYPVAVPIVGRTAAGIAALALASNSVLIFYGGFGRLYALTVFLSLAAVLGITMALNRERANLGWYLVYGVALGLLPYSHLTALPQACAIGVAAIGSVLVLKLDRSHVVYATGATVLGAAITLSLYTPAWDQLWSVGVRLSDAVDEDAFTWLDVAALMAGNRIAGFAWLFVIPAASVIFALRYRARAAVLLAAIFAPLAGVTVSEPYGGPFAWSRYTLTALPFILMLLSWVLVRIVSLIRTTSREPDALSVGIGAVVVAGLFLLGPLGVRHTADGPFANGYLSLMPLPAFDVPWDRTPAFYRELAVASSNTTVVETPPLLAGAGMLYRNYYLQHGKRVVLGYAGSKPRRLPEGPYVDANDAAALTASGADFLIVHIDPAEEIRWYWKFVYEEAWQSAESTGSASYMRSLRDPSMREGTSEDLIHSFRKQHGIPYYEDSDIVVWKLKHDR